MEKEINVADVIIWLLKLKYENVMAKSWFPFVYDDGDKKEEGVIYMIRATESYYRLTQGTIGHCDVELVVIVSQKEDKIDYKLFKKSFSVGPESLENAS